MPKGMDLNIPELGDKIQGLRIIDFEKRKPEDY